MTIPTRVLPLISGLTLLGVVAWTVNTQPEATGDLLMTVRRLMDPRTVEIKGSHSASSYLLDPFPFALPEQARDWCVETDLGRLPYERCDPNKPLNVIRLIGGMTNAFKGVLLGAILSFEQNRCFYLDESNSHLRLRNKDQGEDPIPSIVNRYFEPIGLQKDHPKVKQAFNDGSYEYQNFVALWDDLRVRRPANSTSSIDNLFYQQVEGHYLKRTMMKRMWRFLPRFRQRACSGLETHLPSSDEYMAMSVRRGDKTTEGIIYLEMSMYIDEAQKAIGTIFDGRVPTIFVATDDCSALGELRSLRPAWTFVSECDVTTKDSSDLHGFTLRDMKDWTIEQTDAHYEKFFVELLGLVSAKYVIGTAYTNVSWWVFFMRQPDRSTFQMLDSPNGQDHLLNFW
jgi:hypothetical protein